MKLHFRHVALVGKYQYPAASTAACGARKVLDDIAHFLHAQGCEVALEAQTAATSGLTQYDTLDVEAIGKQCDLGLVVGGDGTMLSIGRQLARFGTPLIGINQGRLGFVTDIPLENYRATLTPMLRGEYEEESRAMLAGAVLRPIRGDGFETI